MCNCSITIIHFIADEHDLHANVPFIVDHCMIERKNEKKRKGYLSYTMKDLKFSDGIISTNIFIFN